MLRDISDMYSASLARKERLYIDNVGTLHVQVKNRTQKRLPGHDNLSVIPARLNVKFEESETLIACLKPAFVDELKTADWE